MGCSMADTKAYQVFVKSTPFWEMLELSSHKWHDWIAKNIKEDVLATSMNQELLQTSDLVVACLK